MGGCSPFPILSGTLLLLLLLLLTTTQATTLKGVTYGGGEWSAATATLDSPSSDASLTSLAHLGATHVKMMVTWYTPSINSTLLAAKTEEGSPLLTPTDDAFVHAVGVARGLGMEVLVSPMVDPDWDIVGNARSFDPVYPGVECILKNESPPKCKPPGTPASRALIGCHGTKAPAEPWTCTTRFTEDEWDAWFKNYTAFLVHYAQLATKANATAGFVIAAELMTPLVYGGTQRWQAVIASVKAVYSGPLTVAISPGSYAAIQPWADELAFVGVDIYPSLHPAEVTTAALVEAWQPTVANLAHWASVWNKSVVFTETGFQSRPYPFEGAGVPRTHAFDCSIEYGCTNCTHQAVAYESLFQAFQDQDWWGGALWWLWRSDVTAGGVDDASFTPQGKPASQVLTKYWGEPQRELPPVEVPPLDWVPPASWGPSAPIHQSKHCGVVFGSGEWTAAGVTLTSDSAKESMLAAKAAGVTSIELIPTWFYDPFFKGPPAIWRGGDGTPIRTDSDEEVGAAADFAHSLGMSVSLSLMLDPDIVRANMTKDHIHGRGSLGTTWNSTDGAEADLFFSMYNATSLRYAALAEAHGIESLLLTHEMEYLMHTTAYDVRWKALSTAIRSVYHGKLSVAMNGQPFFKDLAKGAFTYFPDTFDFVGLDCYWPFEAPIPNNSFDIPDIDALVKSFEPVVSNLSAYAAEYNLKFRCTEIGFQSRPYAWQRGLNYQELDPYDCSVHDQCVNLEGQAAVYEAFFRAIWDKPWFDGVYWWIWRSSATAGGLSSDTYTPQGKYAQAVMTKWYNATACV